MSLHIGQVARRVFLVVLACAVALATFTSALAIAELHDHDCAGDSCPTCVVLDMAQAMLSSSATSVTSSAVASIAFAASIFVLAVWALVLSAKTPVSERVLLLI